MTSLASWLLTLVIVSGAAQSQPAGSKPRNGADLAKRRLNALSGAYQMDDAQKKWLDQELQKRVPAYDAYMREGDSLLEQSKAIAKANGDLKEMMQKMADHEKQDPLDIDSLITLVDQHVRPEQRVGGERIRERQKKHVEKEVADYNKKVAQELHEQRLIKRSFQASPPQPPAEPRRDKPIPTGKAGVSRIPNPRSAPTVTSEKSPSENKKQFERHENAGKAKTVVTVARPNEWAKLVADVGARYHFSAAQRATAEGILKDCQRRAEAFRTVHAPDAQRLATITDTRQRAQAQAALDAPIAAIEQELRERIEQIPSAEQRAAVNQRK